MVYTLPYWHDTEFKRGYESLMAQYLRCIFLERELDFLTLVDSVSLCFLGR